MSRYAKKFLTQESGMEFLQFAIIIAITASLAALMMQLRNTAGDAITKANQRASIEFTNSTNSKGNY